MWSIQKPFIQFYLEWLNKIMKTALTALPVHATHKQLDIAVHNFKTKIWVFKLRGSSVHRNMEDAGKFSGLFDQERSFHSYSSVGRCWKSETLNFQITFLHAKSQISRGSFILPRLCFFWNKLLMTTGLCGTPGIDKREIFY